MYRCVVDIVAGLPAVLRIKLNDTYRSDPLVDQGYYCFRVGDESGFTE